MNNRKISKHLLDELLRLMRKYHKTGDMDLLPAKIEVAHDLSCFTFSDQFKWLGFSDLVNSIVSYLKPSATNKDIYAVFELLGYEVVEEVDEVTL